MFSGAMFGWKVSGDEELTVKVFNTAKSNVCWPHATVTNNTYAHTQAAYLNAALIGDRPIEEEEDNERRRRRNELK